MPVRKLPDRPPPLKKPQITTARTLLAMSQRAIEKELGVKNFDPVVFLMKIAADEENDIALRKDAAKAAAPYVHSTLKAVTVTTEEKPTDINLSTSKERLAGMLEAVAKLADLPPVQDLEVIEQKTD